jgi:hypothetical protein
MNGDNNKRGLDMFQFQMDGNVIVSNFFKYCKMAICLPIVFHLPTINMGLLIKICLFFNHCDHIGKSFYNDDNQISLGQISIELISGCPLDNFTQSTDS